MTSLLQELTLSDGVQAGGGVFGGPDDGWTVRVVGQECSFCHVEFCSWQPTIMVWVVIYNFYNSCGAMPLGWWWWWWWNGELDVERIKDGWPKGVGRGDGCVVQSLLQGTSHLGFTTSVWKVLFHEAGNVGVGNALGGGGPKGGGAEEGLVPTGVVGCMEEQLVEREWVVGRQNSFADAAP